MRSAAALLCGLCYCANLSGNALGAASAAEGRPLPGTARAGAPASQPGHTTTAGARSPKPRPTVRHPSAQATRQPAPPTTGGPPRPERPPTTIPPRPERPPTASPPRPERPPTATPPPRVSSDSRITAARELYQAGRYAEVPTALVKLLSESQLTAAQLAAVYELLASAYVALGQTELAIRCFSEVLNRRPAFALDPVRISPKIRAALDQARREAARPPVGPPAVHRPL